MTRRQRSLDVLRTVMTTEVSHRWSWGTDFFKEKKDEEERKS